MTPVVACLFPALFFLSFVFRATLMVRRWFYRWGILGSYRPRVRVVSVGNLTLGGSGKTPMAAALARYFSARGRRPAVILRGYARPARASAIGDLELHELGDEGSFLKEHLEGRCQVYAARNRALVARRLDAEASCDVIILDDGFQHLALKRDLDIVMVDVTRPFGNGCLLPAGPLREPRGALRRANIICLARCDEAGSAAVRDLEACLHKMAPKALIVESVHASVGLIDLATLGQKSLNDLVGVSVGIFCGIGNPSSFEASVARIGARIAARRFFDDHYAYRPQDLAQLFREGSALGVKVWVTTEKDAARMKAGALSGGAEVPVWALQVVLVVTEGQGEFYGRLSVL